MIARSPLRVSFVDARGRTVLQQVASPGGARLVAPVPQAEFGTQSAPPATLYAPFAFLVGSHSISQFPAGQWQGNLRSVTQGGIEYGARAVLDARPQGGGVRLLVATSDPTGRRLIVTVAPQGRTGLRVQARPETLTGVAAMSDSFVTPADEALHGFGGRHDSLDERGHEFYDWLTRRT